MEFEERIKLIEEVRVKVISSKLELECKISYKEKLLSEIENANKDIENAKEEYFEKVNTLKTSCDKLIIEWEKEINKLKEV